MSNEEVNKIVEVFEQIYFNIKAVIEEIYLKIKSILVNVMFKKENKIRKYINIYNRTKVYRIKKKQLKLIIRGIQVYFI